MFNVFTNFAALLYLIIYIMKTIAIIFALLVGATTAMAQHGRAQAPAVNKAPALNAKNVTELGLGSQQFTQKADNVWTTNKGVTIYSSHPYGDNIKGYSGATPLFIAVDKSGKIVGVAPAANAETPQFWKRLTDAKFFKAWKGLTLQQAASKKVDAVTGATFSSNAVIQTVQATAKQVKK